MNDFDASALGVILDRAEELGAPPEHVAWLRAQVAAESWGWTANRPYPASTPLRRPTIRIGDGPPIEVSDFTVNWRRGGKSTALAEMADMVRRRREGEVGPSLTGSISGHAAGPMVMDEFASLSWIDPSPTPVEEPESPPLTLNRGLADHLRPAVTAAPARSRRRRP